MTKKKIKGNFGNLLTYLGTLYQTPANAIKEYVSNALDEWMKLRAGNKIESPCEVNYHLEKTRITIDYNSPGMDMDEFEAALGSVADSVKPGLGVKQIGRLGIGIFAFNQIGGTCTFFSKKAKGTPTIKVALASNSDEYEIETATKREARPTPGITIVITRLHQDPTRPRGPLAPQILQRFFAEEFDSYLREGSLKIAIFCGDKSYMVEPPEINLPRIGEGFSEMQLSSDWQKKFHCQFWFDAAGKSRVSIRHTGVSILTDLGAQPAYGLEESIYASGFIKGYIDADFLKPLPSRTSFEENEDWVQFLLELDKMRPFLEEEVEELRRKEEEKKLTEVQRKAIEIARDILDLDEFKDLELLGGLRKARKPVANPGVTHKKGDDTGERSLKEGEPEHTGGFRINYQEVPFEDGPSRHSEFVSGTIRVNELNPDFIREKKNSAQAQLAYATIMIGKEAIVYNDKTKNSGHFLEKLLTYVFQVKEKTGTTLAEKPKRPRKTGKKKDVGIHKQTALDLNISEEPEK
jgi:hypothetical protein